MTKRVIDIWNRFERFVGGLKFAVIIISLFSCGMVAGTLLESYYGTDFANRVVYKNWPFMVIQFFMFLSILFATFARLPPRRRLYGFYAIHTGLILIGCGSLTTYLAGVDGSLHMETMTPSKEVVLDRDILQVAVPEEGRKAVYTLPYTPFATSLNHKYSPLDIELVKYLPFSQRVFSLERPSEEYPSEQYLDSAQYRLQNPNISQDFWLSRHPEATEFESNMKLGPLSISYLPRTLADCFDRPSASQLIIWNRSLNQCYTPEEKGIRVKTASSGRRFLAFKEKGKLYSFFPEVGPLPLDEKLNIQYKSAFKVFSKKLFTQTPHLLLFGKHVAFYLKNEKKWEVHSLDKSKPVELPWMGFELSLLQHTPNLVPTLTPTYTLPIQSEGTLVHGDERAVLLNIRNQPIWITNHRPVALSLDGRRITLQVGKASMRLPFEFVLERFKMDKDPGTNRPASFESFVRVFSDQGPEKHHIYMNNPLKKAGFTFYQASYSQDEQGRYSSTLSVNADPGRPIKYLGSLFLVFGAIGHYNLNKRKKRS